MICSIHVLTNLASNESWVLTLCIYVLKEIVDKYRSINGDIYECLLYASKTFDRVKSLGGI